MKLFGLLALFGSIVLFEVPKLWKNKMWKELVVFAGFLLISMVMAFTAVFDIKLPNPTVLIDMVFEPISHVVASLFE